MGFQKIAILELLRKVGNSRENRARSGVYLHYGIVADNTSAAAAMVEQGEECKNCLFCEFNKL